MPSRTYWQNPALFISNINSQCFLGKCLWLSQSEPHSEAARWDLNVCRIDYKSTSYPCCIYVNLQCKLQFSVAPLAVLQHSAAAAVARQRTVFHSSTELGRWAEVSFSSLNHTSVSVCVTCTPCQHIRVAEYQLWRIWNVFSFLCYLAVHRSQLPIKNPSSSDVRLHDYVSFDTIFTARNQALHQRVTVRAFFWLSKENTANFCS